MWRRQRRKRRSACGAACRRPDRIIRGFPEKIQLQVWDTDWTDPQEMYDAGFSIINSLSSSLYLIPGGGYDRLDLDFLEKKVAAERFRNAGANLGASAVVEPDAGSLLHAVERLCIAGWK